MTTADATPLDPGPAPPAPLAATELLLSREAPLGGPRAMSVRRTLPQRQRSLIGPWCFIDHFGPDDVSACPPPSSPTPRSDPVHEREDR